MGCLLLYVFHPNQGLIHYKQFYSLLRHWTTGREKRRKKIQWLCIIPIGSPSTHAQTYLLLLCSLTCILRLALPYLPFPFVFTALCVCLWNPLSSQAFRKAFKPTWATARYLEHFHWQGVFGWEKSSRALVAVLLCMEVRGRGKGEQAKKGYVLNISIRNLN